MAFDVSGNLYVMDNESRAIVEFLAVNGVVPANPAVVSNSSFPSGEGLAVDAGGNIYVAQYSTYGINELIYSTLRC